MDTFLSSLSAIANGLISLAIIGAILSPKVHDGVVIKTGLIGMAAGFGALALLMFGGVKPHDATALERSLMLVNAGIAVVIIGYLLRKARQKPCEKTDWGDL